MITQSLRRIMKVAAVTLPLMSFGAQSALADIRNFTLINNGASPILFVYLTDAGTTTWGSDILRSDDVIPAGGGSREVSFPSPEADKCIYDIKVTNEAGDGVIYGIDLCTETSVIFE